MTPDDRQDDAEWEEFKLFPIGDTIKWALIGASVAIVPIVLLWLVGMFLE